MLAVLLGLLTFSYPLERHWAQRKARGVTCYGLLFPFPAMYHCGIMCPLAAESSLTNGHAYHVYIYFAAVYNGLWSRHKEDTPIGSLPLI
jgi:hypothetical protein